MGGGFTAVVISTVAIVIFGEIIPQAVGLRYGLAIGAACVPVVSALMWIIYPVAYPIALLLDKVVGVEDVHTYRKAELKSLLQFHCTGEEPLTEEEITILTGVLELGNKRIDDIMTPIQDVVTLSADTILDQPKLDELSATGYSRFPVHAPGYPTAFDGLLILKQLLRYDLSQSLPVSDYPLSILPEALPTINCLQALSYFRTGRSHLLLISKTPGRAGGAIGVVTLEDVIEEIISEEIVDETDLYQDNVSKRYPERSTTSDTMRGIVENLDIFSSLPATPTYESDSTLMGRPSDDDELRHAALDSDKLRVQLALPTKRIEDWRQLTEQEQVVDSASESD
ncbi:hypothetical protein E1B28_009591 [Marasmius oreades]|uniref:CNNM transmembrane domain-containing protein n=1 Tax=Marasmius oreades TaxID=181124 RepID=A0A9P7RVJ7_9AGAR|nr:uncharacterized protein E1B28_009591 [Marasmius oreades]KAG7090477.1 hypothetical protein E1B28_009591 [Marasmius oreades]